LGEIWNEETIIFDGSGFLSFMAVVVIGGENARRIPVVEEAVGVSPISISMATSTSEITYISPKPGYGRPAGSDLKTHFFFHSRFSLTVLLIFHRLLLFSRYTLK